MDKRAHKMETGKTCMEEERTKTGEIIAKGHCKGRGKR